MSGFALRCAYASAVMRTAVQPHLPCILTYSESLTYDVFRMRGWGSNPSTQKLHAPTSSFRDVVFQCTIDDDQPGNTIMTIVCGLSQLEVKSIVNAARNGRPRGGRRTSLGHCKNGVFSRHAKSSMDRKSDPATHCAEKLRFFQVFAPALLQEKEAGLRGELVMPSMGAKTGVVKEPNK